MNSENDKPVLETICFNCNQFLPYPMYEATAYGVCLNDEAIDPYIDDIFDDNINPELNTILDAKKYPGEKGACENFDPVDLTEFDEEADNPFVKELIQLKDNGQLNKQTIDIASENELIRLIDDIDWKTVPIDKYAAKLKSNDRSEQDEAISSLSGLIAFGNTEALNELFSYFIGLPAPASTPIFTAGKSVKILPQLSGPDNLHNFAGKPWHFYRFL